MSTLDIAQCLLDQNRQLLLFGTVLLEQIGLPVPAYPSLVVAGAHPPAGAAVALLCQSLGVAVGACLAADIAWYWSGRRFGGALTRLMCRFSMSPQACVVRSADIYRKYGPGTLLFAKFLPGAGAMTTLLAGTNGTCIKKFIIYDAIGSALWAGSALALGYAFQDTVTAAMAFLKPYGPYCALALVVIAFIAASVYWRARHAKAVKLELAPLMRVPELHLIRKKQK
ncbi:DedA family protein [Allopusillimonas soli]|uniref:DedA family protein n=1 Tax=Allopusillimonas soli TaxID=659016 RepID=A0A853FFX1_9BURK|nr:DedA family protein [Allopusillimonas soli]NYT37391.1 DedA family protein [Allopusillimonas soli]TEA74627.1 DedA family protein [Allopusillimonas soli]